MSEDCVFFSVLDGIIGGRNATWAAADDLKTTVTKSRNIKPTGAAEMLA